MHCETYSQQNANIILNSVKSCVLSLKPAIQVLAIWMSLREKLKCDVALELRSVQLLGQISRERRNVVSLCNESAHGQICTSAFSTAKLNIVDIDTNRGLQKKAVTQKKADIQRQYSHLLGAISSCVLDGTLYRCSQSTEALQGEKLFRRRKKRSNLQNMLWSMSKIATIKSTIV